MRLFPLRVMIAAMLAVTALPAGAAGPPVSQCLAVADARPGGWPEAAPRVIFAALDAGALFKPAQADAGTVDFRYVTHSTWLITSPGGIRAATDLGGWPLDPPPLIATMNNAHSSHWTPAPDPAIRHVLHGWGSDGETPAVHAVVEGDMLVRNVTTDTRAGVAMRPDGNSIFIFETAGLCIGHLGHLHHPLEDRHYARIGRLDVIMVPVDGGMTLSHEGMSELVKRLRPSVLLPMHLRGNSIGAFLSMLGDGFDARFLDGDAVGFSLKTLPARPTVYVPAALN